MIFYSKWMSQFLIDTAVYKKRASHMVLYRLVDALFCYGANGGGLLPHHQNYGLHLGGT